MQKVLDNILKIPEAEWGWDRDKIRRQFNKRYVTNWDSLSVFKQDSLRVVWHINEEDRLEKLSKKKHYTPMAQDVQIGLGGDGESINWELVNSAYREAVQELILITKKQQNVIDSLNVKISDFEKEVLLISFGSLLLVIFSFFL